MKKRWGAVIADDPYYNPNLSLKHGFKLTRERERAGRGKKALNFEDNMIKSPLDTLKELRDIDKLKGLEIGALATPLVVRKRLSNGGEIFYLDHLSTEALQKKYSKDKSVEVDQIVPVDYVCPDGELLKAVKGDCFDYIVSSHVIEHTPNPLKFLSDVWAMLKPGGLLFLIIPDKRFTFDVRRPITTFGVALQNFYLKKSKPDVAAVYDHFL